MSKNEMAEIMSDRIKGFIVELAEEYRYRKWTYIALSGLLVTVLLARDTSKSAAPVNNAISTKDIHDGYVCGEINGAHQVLQQVRRYVANSEDLDGLTKQMGEMQALYTRLGCEAIEKRLKFTPTFAEQK